jgi:hypothetical protein
MDVPVPQLPVPEPTAKPSAAATAAPTAAPTAVPSAVPAAEPQTQRFTGSVFEARKKGCTTKIVEGLSRQIMAEANCIAEGSFAELPELDNVTLDPSVFPFLAQPARDALVQAAKAYPTKTLEINSMLRTVAQQYLLYDWYQRGRCGITLAARPGKSNHEGGLSIDISRPARWRKRLAKHGFKWFGKRDRWHFDYKTAKHGDDQSLDVKAFQRLWNLNHPDDVISEDGDYGKATEERLKQAPSIGFPLGPSCSQASSDQVP